MILWGGAGNHCDDGIEFMRLLLSYLPLRKSSTRRAVFFFVENSHQHEWFAQRPPHSHPGSGGPRHGNNPESLLDSSGTPLRGESRNWVCPLGLLPNDIPRPRVGRPFGVGSSIRMKLTWTPARAVSVDECGNRVWGGVIGVFDSGYAPPPLPSTECIACFITPPLQPSFTHPPLLSSPLPHASI